MLYGSELWSLTKTELIMLERINGRSSAWYKASHQMTSNSSPRPSRIPLSCLYFRKTASLHTLNHKHAGQWSPKTTSTSSSGTPQGEKGSQPPGKDFSMSSASRPSISFWKPPPARRHGSIQPNVSWTSRFIYHYWTSARILGDCALPIGKPAPHPSHSITPKLPEWTTSGFAFWWCDVLEADASWCKLRHSEPEDRLHFIAKCPALSNVPMSMQSRLLSATPEAALPHIPDLETNPRRFTEVMLGLDSRHTYSDVYHWFPSEAEEHLQLTNSQTLLKVTTPHPQTASNFAQLKILSPSEG